MTDFKKIFLEKFETDIASGRIKSVCDMGSGKSKNFTEILKKFPNLEYVGIEPSKSDADDARKNLSIFKNARIHNSDGYNPIEDEKWGQFDLVISLSVLEHVKQIEKFIKNSVDAAASGGIIVHRWDLGHALYPSSLKESFQVWIGNNFYLLLPENKFVRKLKPETVTQLLTRLNVTIDEVTYHQMPNHKAFQKSLIENNESSDSLIREIVEWEFKASPFTKGIKEDVRLSLFPTIAVWGRKK